MQDYAVPGVYRRETFVRPRPALPTGVPALVGFVAAGPGGPVALHHKAELAQHFSAPAPSYLDPAVSGFFDNGGAYCYVLGVPASVARAAAPDALLAALDKSAGLDDIDLVAVPDAVTLTDAGGALDEDAVLRVQRAALEHCRRHRRFALLDALPRQGARDIVAGQLAELQDAGAATANGALYYPWIRTTATGERFVPPCGHVAGVIARTDRSTGVFQSPANAEILGAVDVQPAAGAEDAAQLNPKGVNCLLPFPGRGIRVWGARTVSRDAAWRYISVRRLVLTLVRWIDINMAWASFEPNVPHLWIRIRRELAAHLTALWRAGALKGLTGEEAFYVKCDAETNPPERREAGEVVTEIGLAPALPAEFIVLRIQHRAGTTELI